MIINVNNGNTSVVQNTEWKQREQKQVFSLSKGEKDKSPTKGRRVASKMNGKILYGCLCVCSGLVV